MTVVNGVLQPAEPSLALIELSSSVFPSAEVSFSSFDILGTVTNTSVTVNASGELVLSTFAFDVSEIVLYIEGETEVTFGNFAVEGSVTGLISAVISGAIEFGTDVVASATTSLTTLINSVVEFGSEISLAAANLRQRLEAALDLGVRLEAQPSNVEFIVAVGVELVRRGAAFVRDGAAYVTNAIRSTIRRY